MSPASKRLAVGLVSGIALVLAGVWDSTEPRLGGPVRARLESELDEARAHGHSVTLLLMKGDGPALTSAANSRSEISRQTILGLSSQSAVVALSAIDRKQGDDAATQASDLESRVGPFLHNDDLPGAAALLVRMYTSRLVSQGVLASLPPRPPLLYPDIERRPMSPADTAKAGLGLALLVYVLGEWLSNMATHRPINSGTTNNHQ
jgi:hypothetical protein